MYVSYFLALAIVLMCVESIFYQDDWEKYIVKEHGIQIEIDEEDEEEEVDGICNKHCGELHA